MTSERVCQNCLGTGFVSYEATLSKSAIVVQERVQPCHLCQGSWKEWATKLTEEYRRQIREFRRSADA